MRVRAAACWAALLAVGCGLAEAPPRPGDGPGGREQALALTPQQELAVGRRTSQEVRAEYRDRLRPDDEPDVRRVRRVTEKLVRAAGIEPLQREINLKVRGYRFEWEVDVIRERQANAFCLPAGKIFVFTGILRVAADDGELAAVLAHEMAHALAHHGSERVARQQGGENILRSLHYDRMQESEADKIGLFLMPFAGYDPDEAVEFWQRMMNRGGGGMPEFLSDHPSPGTRVRNLRQWANRARAAKAAYDRGDIAPPR
jgi:metalloendopeptidase OMA1, mitochondrial